MYRLLVVLFLQLFLVSGNAQELMSKIEDSDVTKLLDLPAVVTLNDGIKIVGTVDNAYLIKGHLTNVSLKLQDGSTRKFKPTEIESLKVRCAKPTMFSLVDSLGNTIKKVINTQFVFEHPFKTEKKVKPEMRQLLNPVYDTKIKIFPDPNANQSRSISIKGEPLSSSKIDAYIFVKGDEIFYVKSTSYEKDFVRLFGDCKVMMQAVPPNQIVFEGISGHVLLYDHYCEPGKINN